MSQLWGDTAETEMMTTQPNAITTVAQQHSDAMRLAEAELASIEALLVDAELRLATLKQRIVVFEQRYRRMAAGLCEQLCTLNAQIAALCIDRINAHDGQGASQPRAGRKTADTLLDDITALPDFVPSESLQKLYREAAKRFHPDFAESDADRVWRTQMMQEVNAAFASGDDETLQRLLKHRTGSVALSTEADTVLAAITKKILQARSRLDQVIREEAEIEMSDLGQLYCEAKKSGQDAGTFLRNLVVALKAEIDEKKELLEHLLTVGDMP